MLKEIHPRYKEITEKLLKITKRLDHEHLIFCFKKHGIQNQNLLYVLMNVLSSLMNNMYTIILSVFQSLELNLSF